MRKTTAFWARLITSWLAALIFVLSVTARPAAAGCYDPLPLFYVTCHSRFADFVAGAMALPFALTAVSVAACAALPVHAGYKIASDKPFPDDEISYYAFMGTYAPLYAVVGAPLFAMQWLFWDSFHGPCPPDWRSAPQEPQVLPAEKK